MKQYLHADVKSSFNILLHGYEDISSLDFELLLKCDKSMVFKLRVK